MFNRITRTQDALVSDFPGLTRDRHYGQANYNNKSFIVVDTGGLISDDESISQLMSKQVKAAIDDADHVCFVVDGRAGLNAEDERIAKELRKTNKKIMLIIIK